MFYYYVYGVHIASVLDFPQLVIDKNVPEKPDVVIVEGDICDRLNDKVTTNKWEFGETYTWFINSTGWYEITDGDKITYQCKPGANISYLRSYILGLAMAMLFAQRHMLAVHCSAVSDEFGALLISGESGAGKSSLTTELLKEGFAFVADDVVMTGMDNQKRIMAYPAFPYQKLCRDVVDREGYALEELIYIDEDKDKFLVPYKGLFSSNLVPVKTMIFLTSYNGNTVKSTKIEGLDKVKAIYQNLFLRKLYAYEKVNPFIFKMCLDMAAGIDIIHVMRPMNGYTLMQVKDIVLNEYKNGGGKS